MAEVRVDVSEEPADAEVSVSVSDDAHFDDMTIRIGSLEIILSDAQADALWLEMKRWFSADSAADTPIKIGKRKKKP